MGKLPSKTYISVNKNIFDFDNFRGKLKLKSLEAKRKLHKKYPKVGEFFKERNLELEKIRQHSAKLLSAGTITGVLLLTPPSNIEYLPPPREIIERIRKDIQKSKPSELNNLIDSKKVLIDALNFILPPKPRNLTQREEKFLEQMFKDILGVDAKATLEGEHLNTTYGYIGLEMHLRRYPGDSLKEHGEGSILKAGLAKELGAWGYFANSKEKLSKELEEVEKYYVAVQTLYLPDWNKRQPYLKDWYKFRKVLVVDKENGNAVVASVADAGPAIWTGKSFGGSPEVMQALGGEKYRKGLVVVFFIDDPENNIPLGPIVYN